MVTFILIVAFTTLAHLIYSIVEYWLGFRSIKNLSLQTSLPSKQLPSVSIIFSALNEAENLTESLSAMLHLDYPQLEIIAINDRSTDQTGAILDDFSKKFSKLRVIHITKLPDNWLGKNHALYLGAKKATGEWLLFTDADVLMDHSLLIKTMSYVLEKHIDHLTIYERHVNKSFWLKLLLFGIYIPYCLFMKPWRIRYKWSKKHLGHGAFNLVKKSAYQHSGGHRAIAMECMDDVRLGKLLKDNGFKQDTVNGRDYIEREWYSSLSDMVHGLKKNCFAYFDYNLSFAFGHIFFCSLYYFWPLIAVIFFSGPIFWINIFIIMLTLFVNASVAKQFRLNMIYTLFYPLALIMSIFTVCYSIFLTYYHNGIYWRDTHYLLDKLRDKPIPSDIIVN